MGIRTQSSLRVGPKMNSFYIPAPPEELFAQEVFSIPTSIVAMIACLFMFV